MINFKLDNGLVIPCIGYGTYPQKETLEKNVPIAISLGYRLIDASDNYHNEEYIGNGIRKCESQGNTIIVSKFSQPNRTYELEKCFEESRMKLGGRIHIYLLHWPYPFLWKAQWKRIEKLYQERKCDVIGVCNFEEKHLRKLLKICSVKPMINQMEIHPFFQQQEMVSFCQENGIQLMAYSPLARMDKTVMDNPLLNRIAQNHQKSIGQVVFRWDIQHNFIPIPGSKTKKHMSDNINIFDFELSQTEMAQIDSLEAGMRIRFAPDRRFTNKEKIRFLINKLRHVGR